MVALIKCLKEFEEFIERQLFHNFMRINMAVTGNVDRRIDSIATSMTSATDSKVRFKPDNPNYGGSQWIRTEVYRRPSSCGSEADPGELRPWG